jgi:hypothetical protein
LLEDHLNTCWEYGSDVDAPVTTDPALQSMTFGGIDYCEQTDRDPLGDSSDEDVQGESGAATPTNDPALKLRALQSLTFGGVDYCNGTDRGPVEDSSDRIPEERAASNDWDLGGPAPSSGLPLSFIALPPPQVTPNEASDSYMVSDTKQQGHSRPSALKDIQFTCEDVSYEMANINEI